MCHYFSGMHCLTLRAGHGDWVDEATRQISLGIKQLENTGMVPHELLMQGAFTAPATHFEHCPGLAPALLLP